ncbi:unnamed protein product [Rhodiola kirilowii]
MDLRVIRDGSEEMAAKETNDRAGCAENDAQLLKQELAELQAEKVTITVQHKQCTETITLIETNCSKLRKMPDAVVVVLYSDQTEAIHSEFGLFNCSM